MTIGLIAYYDRGGTTDGDAPVLARLHSIQLRSVWRGRTSFDTSLEIARGPRSWALLARLDFEANRFADAAVSYERAQLRRAKVHPTRRSGAKVRRCPRHGAGRIARRQAA
jgi:hypothetical protein